MSYAQSTENSTLPHLLPEPATHAPQSWYPLQFGQQGGVGVGGDRPSAKTRRFPFKVVVTGFLTYRPRLRMPWRSFSLV